MSAVAFWPRTTQQNVASYRIRCAQIRTALAGMGMETDLIGPRGPSPDAPAPRVLVMVKNFGREALDRAFAWRAASGTRLILDICDDPFFEGAAGKRPGADPARLAADLERAEANGMRPLLMAALNGHVDVARQLLAAGADPREGTTAVGL